MKHPDREVLLAHVDGELAWEEDHRVQSHLQRCFSCRAHIAELRATAAAFATMLQHTDDAEPAAWAAAGPAGPLAARPPGAPSRAFEPVLGRPYVGAGFRRAAGIALMLGAAGAAAMLGLPLLQSTRTDVPAVEPTPASPAVESGGAIAMAPADGVVDIELSNAVAGTRIIVAFEQQADVLVEVAESERAAFRAERGRISVDLGAQPALLRLRYPAALRAGIIRVNGEELARVLHGELRDVREVTGVTVTRAEVR